MENEIDLEKKIKELDNIICKAGQSAQTVHMLTKPQAFYDNTHKQALGYQNPFYLKKAQRIKPTLYDGVVMSNAHVAMLVIDDEETLILEEVVDVPSELPKVSLVNASFKKLKFHLTQFDSVVKKRTTPNALEEDIFNVFDKDLLNEITEVLTVFDQIEVTVQQSSVNKQCLEIAKKEILLENDRLLQKIMSQDVLLTVMNSMSLHNDSVNMEMQEYFEINDLKSRLQDKDKTICKLKDTIQSLRENTKEENVNHNVFKDQFDSIKQTRVRHKEQWKEMVENVIHTPSVTTIAPGMFKLHLVPLPPRELDFACKYATRIQELLVYVQDTCPIAVKNVVTMKVAIYLLIENKKLDEDLQGKQVDAILYRGMIGSLMYLTASRPDLNYDVCLYADRAGCQDTRRSTSGSAQFLSDKLVSWSLKKQKSTAISNYGFQFNKIPLYCENKSAIALCYNNVQHSRAKHIDIRYHFIKEQVENGIVELYFVRAEYQLADIFTKLLPRERFNFLINKLGTDIAKITRKRSKPDKHGHENG
ncbi:hypothetical protein Tco_0925461 [Tanacetum coccineum]|uniref:Reverse transcriptase Ty1/copia-type domain-containing protein n=1 Tax=Tanacetum coccineum TaxID=301880 RepID=A0ABQ5D9J1_9ASTR